MNNLNELMLKITLRCGIDETNELINNYNEIFYYKNNNVIIPLDFYNRVYSKTFEYINTIDLEKSYGTKSTINYKLNILKLLFRSFKNEHDFNKQLDYIYNIFNVLIFIIENQ
jgi:hypothetical protein